MRDSPPDSQVQDEGTKRDANRDPKMEMRAEVGDIERIWETSRRVPPQPPTPPRRRGYTSGTKGDEN